MASGVYNVRWLLSGPADVAVRAEVAAAGKIEEFEDGLAGRLPEMHVVAGPAEQIEFHLRGPSRPDLNFRGVELRWEPIDAKLAAIEYGQVIRASQFLTLIGQRLPDQSLASRGRSGFLCYGPYQKLPRGKYNVQLILSSTGDAKVHGDVAADGVSIAAADAPANHFPALEFSSDGKAALEFRVVTSDGASVIFDGAKLVPLE